MENIPQKLQYAVMRRRRAQKEYQEAIREARAAGYSHAKIGALMGVSEPSIRMYAKRHDLNPKSDA